MIYELRSYVLTAGRRDEYLRVAAEVSRPIRGDRYGKLEGHWFPVTGNVDRVIHLWSYSDFGERDRLRRELANDARWTTEFLPLLPALISKQENRLLNVVGPFRPPPAGRKHVYELRFERAPVGSMRRHLDVVTAAATREVSEPWSVGIWETAIGTLNEVVRLRAHESVESAAAANLTPSYEPSLLAHCEVEILVASPSSPIG